MAALAADKNRLKRGTGVIFSFPMAASKIYKGGIVHINAAGFAAAGSDTTAQVTAGIALETVDNTGGAAGAKTIRVEAQAEFKFTATSITQAMVGTNMVTVTDNDVDDAAGATNDIVVGKLTQFISTTEGWVFVPGLTATP